MEPLGRGLREHIEGYDREWLMERHDHCTPAAVS
jgi:hypothetical protein